MLTWDTTGDDLGTGYLIDRRQARELNPEDAGKCKRRRYIGPRGRVIADKWRLQIGPSSAIHRLEVEPMGGATDVQSGSVSAGPQGGDGGGDEHPGGGAGVRVAPRHGAQNAGVFSTAGLPAADSAPQAQPFDKLRRSPAPASSTRSWKRITASPRSSATPPSVSSSGSGTSTGSAVGTPRSRTTSGSTAARRGRCSCRSPIPRAMPSATSARQW